MSKRLEILSGPEWQRVLAYARDLNILNAESQSDSVLGIRLGNVLVAAGWTVFTSQDYARACTAIREHYAAKEQQVEVTEEQAFEKGLGDVWYNVASIINMARTAYEYSQSKNPKAALSGYTRGCGRNAEHMARAYEYWQADWFADTDPRAKTPHDCLTLFALASLSKLQAHEAYNYWRDHSSDMTYFQVLEYVKDLKNKKRPKDDWQYHKYRRDVLRDLHQMQDTAAGTRQATIEGIISTVKEKL